MKCTYLSLLVIIALALPRASYGQTDMHEGHDHAAHAEPEPDEHAGHDHADHMAAEEDEHEGHDHDAHAEQEEESHEGHGHDEHAEEGGLALDDEIMADLGIELAVAAGGTLSSHVILPGEVQVNQDRLTHIVPRYSGLVTEVRKSTGDHAEQGEVLAVLESNESLAPYELKSLISGTVIDKHITVGESLGEDAVVFTIADLETVWIVLTVFQKDLDSVYAGRPVDIASGHKTTQGVISYISPTLDEETRTAHARVLLPNDNGEWKPGMFVRGRVQTGKTKAQVVVPASAVQNLEGEDVVFVRDGNGFVSRPVVVGRRTSKQVEITEGLNPGMEYVSSGAFHLKAEIITSGLGAHAGHGH